MERRRFLQWIMGVPLAGSAFLAGCGGGQSVNASGSGVKVLRGVAKLPTGFSLPAATLKVEAGFGNAPLGNDLGFDVAVLDQAIGPTLAWLRDADKVLFVGFIDSSSLVIDAESTAVALLYFSLGGFMLPPEDKKTLLGLIKAESVVGPLTEAVARRVAANPYALTEGDPELGAALKTATNALLAARPTRAVGAKRKTRADALDALLQISPTGLKSNVEVLQGTTPQSFIATNHARRWCKVFVYETGTQSKTGAPVNYAKAKQILPSLPLSSTRALGIRTSLFGFYSGDSTFTPVSTSPFTLNLVDGSAKTFFEIVVLGSSSLLFDPGFFTDPKYAEEVARWKDELIALNLISWLGDVVFGLLLEVWGMRGLVQKEEAVLAAVKNFREVEIAGWFAVLALAESGKFGEATTAFLSFASKNIPSAVRFRAALAPLLPALGASVGQQELLAGAQLCLKMFLAAFAAADLVLGAVDLGAVLYDLAHAERGELWQATLVRQEVHLSPTSATLIPGGHTDFTAVVPAGASGRTLKYKWSVAAAFAVLTDTAGGHSGKTLETTSPTVTLATTPSDKSDITVSCEVFSVAADSTSTSLGVAQALVTMKEDDTPPFGSVVVTLSNPPGGGLDPTLVRGLDGVRAQQIPPDLGLKLPIIIESSHELVANFGPLNTQLFLSLNFGNEIKTGQQIALDFSGNQKLSLRLAGPTTGGARVRFIATGGSFTVIAASQSGFPATETIRFRATATMVGQDDPSLNFTATFNGWISNITLL